MKQQFLRTVSTCALVVAMSGGAFAQTGGAGGGSPSGPPSQSQQRNPDSGPGDGGRGAAPRSGGETVQPKDTPSAKQPSAEQRSDERTAPRKQDRSETRGDQKQPRADRKDDGQRSSERGQTSREQDKGRAKTGQEQTDRGPDRGKDVDRQRQGAREDRDRQDRGRAQQLSEQQRTSVRERFNRAGAERNRDTNVNFDIRIGASVPRSVTLHALPADVIEVVPEYRSYRYVYVRDEIVIVDPDSYAVVAVVTTGGSRAAVAPRRTLTLAAPDRAFLREHIDRGASIRLGIGGLSIGMTLPQGVGLLPMPEAVVERYPDLRDYRYFVYEDDIAVVDPATDEIILIVAD